MQQKWISTSLTLGLCLVFSVGCDSGRDTKKESSAGPALEAADMLLIAPQYSEQVTTVYHYDTDSGAIEQVLSDQGADPYVANLRDHVLLVQRKAEDKSISNVRQLKDDKKTFDKQVTNPMPKQDPKAMVGLGDSKALVASYSASELGLFDFSGSDAYTYQKLDLDIQVTGDFEFLPNQMLRVGDFVYVSHEGWNLSSDLKPNGSQAVYVIEIKEDNQIQAVDWQPEEPGVQGIRIKGQLPARMFQNRSEPDLLYVFSICSPFVNTAVSGPCWQGVESIHRKTGEVQTVWKIPEGIALWGGLTELNGSVYVSAKRQVDGKETYELLKLDYQNQEVSTFYRFSEDVQATLLLLADSDNKSLVFTDQTQVGTGDAKSLKARLIWMSETGEKIGESDPLNANPSLGVILPKE